MFQKLIEADEGAFERILCSASESKIVEVVCFEFADSAGRASALKVFHRLVEQRPHLCDSALMLARVAVNDEQARVREFAQELLYEILEQRPDLAEQIISLAEPALNDSDATVGELAKWVLMVIEDDRPDLAQELAKGPVYPAVTASVITSPRRAPSFAP